MEKVFDKNGVQITVDCEVEVPMPNENDIHHHSFVGIVADILHDGMVIVEDQDSDFFKIEANRLTVISA
jgi:hypothetical protein